MFSWPLYIVSALLFRAFGGELQNQQEVTYQSIRIGEQVWMDENLNTATFRNGDIIPEARTRSEWQQAFFDKRPACCYYGNDPANGETYGRLYNWFAVNDSRGLAPAGWHVPSDAEWQQLTNYLGGGGDAGLKMKNSSGWREDGNGTNESQFSGLPGGACADDGYLGSIGYLGVWWSATTDTSYYYDASAYAWYRYLYYSKGEIIRYSHSKGNGFAVRCLKD